MIKGVEFHSILNSIFDGDIKGVNESEQLQTNCPKCQERDGLSQGDGRYNLEINTEKRVFRCWKCENPRFSGSLGRLIKILGTNIDYQLYKDYAGIFNDYSDNEDEKEFEQVHLPEEFILFSNMNKNNSEHFEAYTYMTIERDISYDLLLKYRIGFCLTGKYWGRIIIPSYDKDGELNYFVGRTFKKQKPPYLNPKVNKDKIIFNEGMINWDGTIYLVEGAFELLSLPTNTIPQLGKTLSGTLFNILKIKKPNIVIILDPDAYRNSIEIYNKLTLIYGDDSHRIKIVKLEGYMDLDQIRRKFGVNEIIKKIRMARNLITEDYFVDNKYFYDKNGKVYSGSSKW